MKLTVLGEGAWGTAVALLCARAGHQVALWCYDQQRAQTLVRTRMSDCLQVSIPDSIEPTSDIAYALQSEVIFEAIPVVYLRSILERARPHAHGQRWVILSKGIEKDTLLLPSQLVHLFTQSPTVTLVGPTLANEVAQGMFASFIASGAEDDTQYIRELLPDVYIQESTDDVGVQVSAALKNVIALAAGMVMDMGQNARAFVLTRGLADIERMVRVYGGRPETVHGLAGVGDLILSAGGGRNAAVGQLLADGVALANIQQRYPVLPEGINSAYAVHQLMHKHDIQLPVCEAVYKVVYEHMSVKEMFLSLARC